MLANPSGDIFGRGVGRENVVEILVVEFFFDEVFYYREIDDHAVAVQLMSPAIYGNNPIVAVQILAFAFVGESQLVRGTYFEAFSDVIHVIEFACKDSERRGQ